MGTALAGTARGGSGGPSADLAPVASRDRPRDRADGVPDGGQRDHSGEIAWWVGGVLGGGDPLHVLSKKRNALAAAELFGTPVSQATVPTMTRRAGHGLTASLRRRWSGSMKPGYASRTGRPGCPAPAPTATR